MNTYESHVTVNPPASENERKTLEEFAINHQFRLSRLFMQKDMPSTEDAFMTGHGTCYEDIILRTAALVSEMRDSGYVVRRYKIEQTLVDSKVCDSMRLLNDPIRG